MEGPAGGAVDEEVLQGDVEGLGELDDDVEGGATVVAGSTEA